MDELSLDAQCRRHPDRQAEGTCDRCGKAYCDECHIDYVPTEQSFCSAECATNASAASSAGIRRDAASLQRGYAHPIQHGARTWANGLPQIVAALVPLALGVAIITLAWSVSGQGGAILAAAYVILGAFGIALVGVLVSRAYTGLDVGNPYLHTLRRLVPWSIAWLTMLGTTLVGYILLIVPGIYWNMRLFWADEFALIHGHGPIKALDLSWKLSKDVAGETFKLEFLLSFLAVPVVLAAGASLAALGGGLSALLQSGTVHLPIFAALATIIGLFAYSLIHAMQLSYFYGLRTHPDRASVVAEARPMPLILKLIGIPAGLAFAGLILLGAMVETGTVPSDRVLAGSELPNHQRVTLLEEKVIDNDERIVLFYSEGLTSVREGGSVLTEKRLIVYQLTDDDSVEAWAIANPQIGVIEQIQQGDALNFSVYRVDSKDGETSLQLWLPHEYADDKRFTDAVRSAVSSAP